MSSKIAQMEKDKLIRQAAVNRRLANLETADSISPAWLEYYIASGQAKAGASAPTSTLRAIGASGGVLIDVQQFSKTTQQEVYFEWHAPRDMDNTVYVNFHLMWIPGTGYTAGNYLWKLEYLVKSDDDPYNTGTPSTLLADVTPANAINMIETEFVGNIPILREQILCCHFYRDVAGDNADDTGDVNFFEIVYRIDRFGSVTA